ncbi:MAG: nitrous oxide reductase family maturation protein NosD [Gemmatimonadaceae bacterium]
MLLPVKLWSFALLFANSSAQHESSTSKRDHRVKDTVVVDAHGPVTTITQALKVVARGGFIRVRAGIYREPTIEIHQPVTLVGDSGATLDGDEQREILIINADSVSLSGFVFQNTGTSQATDRAAVRVLEASACTIQHNRFINTLFGIYLQHAHDCRIADNDLIGRAGSQTVTGNGIHLWSSRDILIERNAIHGHRDAIYFEFVRNSIVRNNIGEHSHRYGLHFMFSDSCRYENNTFRANESGVAVMYSHVVAITGNRFSDNRGPSTYGLLLKEITDSEIRGNIFADNSVALHMEGASRNLVADNEFLRNGWALRILGDAIDNRVTSNSFANNLFDVGTNSRTTQSVIVGNWWDRYRGYDLNHDGIGDVPHAPVRLFALLVAQAPTALLLVHSPIVDILDVVERVIPAITPLTLIDSAPLMHAPRRLQ